MSWPESDICEIKNLRPSTTRHATKFIFILAPLLMTVSGCGNREAEADLAGCDKQFPAGVVIDGDRDRVIDCMREKGWKTDFLTGISWWQTNKYARKSSTYSK